MKKRSGGAGKSLLKKTEAETKIRRLTGPGVKQLSRHLQPASRI